MILFVEGLDRCGKSTQITKIQPLLIDKPLHVLHYSAIKGFSSTEEVREYSERLYRSMFDILENSYKTNHFILDRSHIGEVVYSPMYRNYDGSYVYGLEKWHMSSPIWKEIYLITFIDDAENVIKRDDGLSFTVELEKKRQEIQAFIDATLKSNIINKKIINIAGKDIETVFAEVRTFLGK